VDEELQVRARLVADAGEFITPVQAATASLQHFQKALQPSTKALVAVGAAAGVAGYAIVKYGKEAFTVAAKVSELRVAIDAVGKSTGLGAKTINDAALAIRKNGIEMDAAQNIALKFAQNNLDLSKAAGVARVAQDLAVISQKNSTETAELLTRAVQTGSSILLKSAGISRYASEGYAMYAKTLGKNATQLTATERQQATINLIMDEGTRVAGLYEAAMTEPGKVLRSFARLQNDIQLEMGNVLLKGFGPMIKSAYDLVKSFSESVREGGAFANILTAMGLAFKDLLQPMTDLLARGHLFFKDLEFGSQSVENMTAQFKKFLPIVTSVGAGLAAFTGKKLLGNLPLVGGAFAKLNPFLTGIILLSALSPKLRDSLVKIVASLKPLVPAVIAMGAAFAEMIGQVAELATGLLDAFGPALVAVFGGLAETFKVLAGAAAMLKPVLLIVGLLLAKHFIVGALLANQRLMKMTVGVKQATVAFSLMRTQIVHQQQLAAIMTGNANAVSKFSLVLKKLQVGFVALRGVVVSFIASMLPLMAIYAGIAVFMAWRKEQQATEERTQALTQAVKDQLYAMKGDVKVINEFVQSQKDLATVMTSGSETADELGQALQVIGADAKDAFKAFDGGKESIRDFNERMIEASGVKLDPSQVANFLAVVENQGGIFRFADGLGGMSASQEQLADSLKRVNDLMKQTDPGAYVLSNMDYLAGIDKLGKEARDYALAEAEKNDAVQGGIDTFEEALIVQELYANKYKQLTAAARASKAASDKIKASFDAESQSAIQLVTVLDKLKDASDDNKVSAEAFSKAFYGGMTETNKIRAAFDGMRKSSSELADSLKGSAGNTDLFEQAGMSLFNQLNENSAAILELGGNTADVARYQQSAIDQFYAAAVAAGKNKEDVDLLLDSLGILAGLKKVTVEIDLQIQRFTEKIKVASAALALFMRQGDRESARMATTFVANMEGMIAQLNKAKDGATSTGDSFRKWTGDTDKASKAQSKLEKEMEKLRRKIMEVAEKALAKAQARMDEYTEAMNAMTQASKSAVYGSYSLTDAFTKAEAVAQEHNDAIRQAREEFKDYSDGVADAVKKTLSFGEALSGFDQMQKDIASANEDATKAQAKLNDESALYADLLEKAETTQGRKARREAFEEAAKQLEKVAEAQTGLSEATNKANESQTKQKSVLERLRAQYQQAVKFSSQLQELVSRGLTREGVDQVLAMGAETGSRFATELLEGTSDAIPEVNKMFSELALTAKKAGDVTAGGFFKIGDEVGADFVAALASRAQDATKFTDTIKRLVALGLSPNNIRMVLEAGVDAGSKIAEAIEKGGVDTVRQMNELESSLRGQAESLGFFLNDSFYKAGFDLASSIVKGMKEQIEALTDEIADATVAQLKAILARVKGEFDESVAKLPIDPATIQGGMGTGSGAGAGGATTVGRRTEEQLRGATAGFASFKEAVKALHPLAVAQYTSDGTGLNATEMAKLKKQFPRLAAVPFAKGGIVSRPTLGLVGEAGPEAVIPLSRMGSMGGDTTFNVTVNAGMGTDGKAVGDAIVNELKKWSRKNGKIPVPTQ
jgi:hypothetical protein